jgi:hypothetical protein
LAASCSSFPAPSNGDGVASFRQGSAATAFSGVPGKEGDRVRPWRRWGKTDGSRAEREWSLEMVSVACSGPGGVCGWWRSSGEVQP